MAMHSRKFKVLSIIRTKTLEHELRKYHTLGYDVSKILEGDYKENEHSNVIINEEDCPKETYSFSFKLKENITTKFLFFFKFNDVSNYESNVNKFRVRRGSTPREVSEALNFNILFTNMVRDTDYSNLNMVSKNYKLPDRLLWLENMMKDIVIRAFKDSLREFAKTPNEKSYSKVFSFSTKQEAPVGSIESLRKSNMDKEEFDRMQQSDPEYLSEYFKFDADIEIECNITRENS